MTQRINTNELTWDKAKLTFSTMASDLGWRAGEWPRLVEIESHKTGKVKVFHLSDGETDREGELIAVRYFCENMLLRIFND